MLWLEHQNFNQEDLVSNPRAAVSKLGQFCSFHIAPVHSEFCINEYLTKDSAGYVKEYR